jgi:hypothetical protein
MIAEVYLWTDDGKVTVFDEHGHQMWDYGGSRQLVTDRILIDAPPSARFYLTNLATGSKQSITREQFGKM